MTDQEQIQCALARLGLRSAATDEAGWYVKVEISTFPGREIRSVWATEAVPRGLSRTRRAKSGRGLPAQAALWGRR